MRSKLLTAVSLGALLCLPAATSAQSVQAGVEAPAAAEAGLAPATASKITTPKEQFGFDIGADYSLINYTQLTAYWKKLAGESDRMKLTVIGKTAEGRDQLMAIVTSPENLKHLDHYQEIAKRLAKAEDLTDDQARALAREGKAVVWIDGGLHATETVGAQQISLQLFHAVHDNDPEMRRILNDVIMLYTPANPDGMELVSNWYMRNPDPTKRDMNIPRLYQKYVGHDNNRDFYMSNMPEAININRVAYREWFPQIMYNHHQPGPEGMVVFMPTFRDPFNYNLDPLSITGLDGVGAAMHGRLIAEGKEGTGRRSAAAYSNWTNGTLRSTSLFHNSIGILTEIIGNPTPMKVPLVPRYQIPRNDEPLPIGPQTWHFAESLEYSMSMNRAVLDYAARNRELLLYDIYRMGKNGIEKGERDNWRITGKRVAALEAAAKVTHVDGAPLDPRTPTLVDSKLYDTILHDPAYRDPRGFIIPADQADFPTAVAFVNSLIKGGVDVLRADKPFTVAGKTYPAGSFVVKTAQAYRAQVMDMFEPQDHPDDFAYPGGPPIPPYDVAGYTLAYQMGVKVDRILDGFDGPFEKVPDVMAPPPGTIVGSGRAGYLISHDLNNSFILQNRLLKAKKPVYWLKASVTADGKTFSPGAMWTPAGPGVREILEAGARQTGVDVYAVAAAPAGPMIKMKPIRIGLVDNYGGVIPAGWTRWILENFEFPFEMLHPQQLDAGHLAAKYDALVFADGVVTGPGGRRPSPQPKAEDIPAEFRPWLGRITTEKTVPQIEAFVRQGGTLITVGSSTRLAYDLKLPIEDALVEGGKHLRREKFFIPGAIMANAVDPSSPLAYGLPPTVNMFYFNSPAFRLKPEAAQAGVRTVASFPSAHTLLSGWAWGQERLDGASSVVEAPLGKGKVFVMGPEVTERGQSQGTYKFLFNGLYYGPATAGRSE